MKLDYGAIWTSDLEKKEGYYMKYSGLTVIVNIQMLQMNVRSKKSQMNLLM